jgi:hypothetical protein
MNDAETCPAVPSKIKHQIYEGQTIYQSPMKTKDRVGAKQTPFAKPFRCSACVAYVGITSVGIRMVRAILSGFRML